MVRMQAQIILFWLGALAALGACTQPTDSDYTDHIAILRSVAIPETVRVHQSFVVTITTMGLDSSWGPGKDLVLATDDGALVVPRDRVYIREEDSLPVIVEFEHAVSLFPRAPGPMNVHVRYRVFKPSGGLSTETSTWRVVVQQ